MLRGFILLLVLLVFVQGARCQGARYDSVAQRTVQGFLAPIPGALVTVCTASGTGTPCSPTASIFLDAGLTQPAPNPFTADSSGNFGFYAAASTTYKYSITATGVTGQLFTVVLPMVGGGNGSFSTLTASGPATFTNINTTIYVGNGTYACTAAGINAALVAARGTGISGTGAGVVDATACTGNITMTAQINVGDTSGDAITLKLPASGGWDFNMTDGTSCGIQQFTKSSIIGSTGSIGQPFALLALTGANMKAVYCTDPSQNSFIVASGFGIKEQSGVTLSTAVADFRNTFDTSQFTDITVLTNGHIGALVTNTCCSTTFTRLAIDAVNSPNGLPLKIGANVNATHFISLSANHPGSGLNVIQVNGTSYGLMFNNTYMESNTTGTDTTTPLIESIGTAGGSFTFTNGIANILSGSTNQYVFKRDSGASPSSIHINSFHMLYGTGSDHNCMNDSVTGLTYSVSNTNNGQCPDYAVGTAIPSFIVGRSGASAGTAFAIDYNSSTELPAMWRNAAASSKNWYVGDGVAQVGRFSFFDVGGAERLGIDTTGLLSLPTAGSALKTAEGTAPSGVSAFDVCYGDSTAHAVKCNYNNATNFLPLQQVISTSLTTTAATTDNVTVTGMTSTGHCYLTPTNSGAAGGIASVFVSAKTTNQITVTHTATSGWTFDVVCTPQ